MANRAKTGDTIMGKNKSRLLGSDLDAVGQKLLAVVQEFVGDIEAPYPGDKLSDLESKWPDLVTTYKHAKAALACGAEGGRST